MEENQFSKEEKFSIFVLSKSKSILGEKSKYLPPTRMTKLVFYIAEKVDFDLTRGWFKYGAYSPSAHAVSKKFAEENLENFNPPKELLVDANEEFGEMAYRINREIGRSWDFSKTSDKFYDWLYEHMAPESVRDIYRSHRSMKNHLDELLSVYGEENLISSDGFFEGKYRGFQETITEFNNNLSHVEDEDILDLFFDFTDLLEMETLKMKNAKPETRMKMKPLFEKLKDLYDIEGGGADIWLTLVPYEETLVGLRANKEKEEYENRVENVKPQLRSEIDFIKEKFDDVMPTREELRKEIKRLDEKMGGERKAIREVYSF